MYTLSDSCSNLIATFEGFSATPYVDPASGGEPVTTGYGTTHYCDGTKVTLSDIPISKEQALEHLLCHLTTSVLPCINQHVTSTLNQNQIDALGSFIYNIGCGNFKTSTLLKKVNIDPMDPSITDEFRKWTRASGKILPGLLRRRNAEVVLYFNAL